MAKVMTCLEGTMTRTFQISITLIVVSVASLGCRESSKAPAVAAADSDPRTAVPLPAEAQQAVLHEMRQMLGSIGGAMSAAASGDTTALQAALLPAGTAAAADPAIEAMLPAEWKELAERTHGGFDDLAAAARRTREPSALKDTVLVGLARISGSCTSCHETFRVTVR
jgi:cytochrome c556